MTSNPFDRAALTLGAVGVVSPVFALSTSSNNNFVLVRDASLVVLVILGACAVIGGATALRPLVLVAGAGYAVATVLQLVQFGRSTNWLNGNGSTFSASRWDSWSSGSPRASTRPATTQADPASTERWVPLPAATATAGMARMTGVCWVWVRRASFGAVRDAFRTSPYEGWSTTCLESKPVASRPTSRPEWTGFHGHDGTG
jgi:hypothetical protein